VEVPFLPSYAVLPRKDAKGGRKGKGGRSRRATLSPSSSVPRKGRGGGIKGGEKKKKTWKRGRFPPFLPRERGKEKEGKAGGLVGERREGHALRKGKTGRVEGKKREKEVLLHHPIPSL